MVVASRRRCPSGADELPHGTGITDEWLFAAWSPDASVGLLSGHRVTGSRGWYWSAFVQARQPLLHLAEWDVRVRADPFIVKAPEMWAEHHCVAPLEQWSIGNEAFFVALDDADEALGRAYGTPTATAMDLEWYANGDPEPITDGFQQDGVVHGRIDVIGRQPIELDEAPATRWRRWRTAGTLATLMQPGVVAHTGLRAPFGFPDGSVADWVLTPQGWRTRAPAPR